MQSSQSVLSLKSIITDSAYSVLIIDQNRESRQTLKYSLESSGFNVFEAENADEALFISERTTPNLIILDAGAGAENGEDILGKLRSCEKTSSVKVMMVKGPKTRQLLTH